MKNTIRIEQATAADLDWVNARYADIDFLPSNANDHVLIASIGAARAGLGRIVPLAPNCGELGGMYVLPDFQGRGVAQALVRALQTVPAYPTLFCVPFAKLESLYAGLGFRTEAMTPGLPPKIVEKLEYCAGHYPQPVILMRWTREAD